MCRRICFISLYVPYSSSSDTARGDPICVSIICMAVHYHPCFSFLTSPVAIHLYTITTHQFCLSAIRFGCQILASALNPSHSHLLWLPRASARLGLGEEVANDSSCLVDPLTIVHRMCRGGPCRVIGQKKNNFITFCQ